MMITASKTDQITINNIMHNIEINIRKEKNTINNSMLNNILPNTKAYYETYKEELNRKSRDYYREKSSKGN